ncbi:hypothetical protein [Bacillus suaedae]|uniref:Uncharacterized protein n=1 Tax=Halalkalibacter suaedae TaxID=2822140 RepID=A0A941ATI2_9BACI|nr:hypothetical protein [Bacillus suaedae]MBP3951869.1 hypothetical protein [Bacillus suaedae]
MKKIILFFMLASVFFNFLPNFIYAEEKINNDLLKVINECLPPNSELISPEEPKSTKPYQLYDLNQDGREDVIINFVIKAEEQPNPSQYGVIVLRKENERWKKVWESQTQGVGLAYSGTADLTGDGINEYLFGVTIGASAGNTLEVFRWNNHSFQRIAEIPNHMMELITDKKTGIAVWQRYIADAYFVNVLKWNGVRLARNEELFSSYYPTIEKFYQDKIAKLDAWFYWYTLADAQIKANLFEKARNSIQKGTELAKESSLPDEVESFKRLLDELEEKQKS